MLIGTKLQRFEALLDEIHAEHPQIHDALLILCESVEKLESESSVCDARHDHHEMRLERAGIRRLDAAQDEFTAGMTPIAEPYASQCPTHGLVRIGGRPCSMCEPSVPALRGEPRLIINRLAETVRPRMAELHAIEDCSYPCIRHDPEAFVVDSSGRTPAGRAINLRESA
jgi:hypothetical protein